MSKNIVYITKNTDASKLSGMILPENSEVRYKDVMVGYPIYDMRPELDSITPLLTEKNLSSNCVGVIQYALGDSLVTRARNKIATKFMESDMEYLMFIDSDIAFKMGDINRLREHAKGVVGGIYLKKSLPYQPVANTFIGVEDDLHVLKEIGTGFMMIHRQVFADIIEKYPEIMYQPEDDEQGTVMYDFFRVGPVTEAGRTRYLSEDYYFCYLARQCGYNIYYDTSVFTRHIGKATYPFNDLKLLETAADLLQKYDTDVELPREIVDAIVEGVRVQMEGRGWQK